MTTQTENLEISIAASNLLKSRRRKIRLLRRMLMEVQAQVNLPEKLYLQTQRALELTEEGE